MSVHFVQHFLGSIGLCSISPFRMRAIVVLAYLFVLATASLTPERYQDDILARLREDHLATLAIKKAPSQSHAEAGYNKERLAHESWDTIHNSDLEKASNLGGLETTPPDGASPYEVPPSTTSSNDSNKFKEERRSSVQYSDYELVLARWKEDVSWGGEESPVPLVPNRPFTVVNRPNSGRESESYMYHIISRWDTLAEYTVFGQAWPFLHSPYFVDLLSSPKLLQPVQCMSLVYLATGHPDNVTPMKVVETYRKHEWYRSERMSLRTLDSIYFNDAGAALIGKQYLQLHQLDPGTNIIAHHLDVVGLVGWVPHEEEIGNFAYGGHIGVDRDHILQHPRHVYENFRASMILTDLHTYIAERTYLILFGGINFRD